jgi:hypothetical protein
MCAGGNEIAAEQMRERRGIDRIGLHLRIADRLHELGMGERQRNVGGREQIAQPVPVGGRLHHGSMRPGVSLEIGADGRPRGGERDVLDRLASIVHRRDDKRPLVQIEPGVKHQVLRRRLLQPTA